MAEDKITAAETANEGAKKSENIVELARPYGFEGKEYGEIDLTGLEKLTVQDAIDVQRQLFGEGEAVMVNVDDCNFRGLGAVRDHDGICPRHGGQGHRNAH